MFRDSEWRSRVTGSYSLSLLTSYSILSEVVVEDVNGRNEYTFVLCAYVVK